MLYSMVMIKFRIQILFDFFVIDFKPLFNQTNVTTNKNLNFMFLASLKHYFVNKLKILFKGLAWFTSQNLFSIVIMQRKISLDFIIPF